MRWTATETERNTAQELLDGLREMEEQAPSVGLCTLPFKLLIGKAEEIIAERDRLAAYRDPKMVKPCAGYAGQCPNCRSVFLDDSTLFCGNCGQALKWAADE